MLTAPVKAVRLWQKLQDNFARQPYHPLQTDRGWPSTFYLEADYSEGFTGAYSERKILGKNRLLRVGGYFRMFVQHPAREGGQVGHVKTIMHPSSPPHPLHTTLYCPCIALTQTNIPPSHDHSTHCDGGGTALKSNDKP